MEFDKRINAFFMRKASIFKKPLEKIINKMIDHCRYINGESLERHNWGTNPVKLKNIPDDLDSLTFEKDLIEALESDENDKSIIELLWGDIQLGKRVHACIIMWISVFILNRPVLYVFRNLKIDQKQLQNDIAGTNDYDFNVQFIKKIFQEFSNEIKKVLENYSDDGWKEYKLPDLKDLGTDGILNKISNKDSINPSDIICCLMNHKQLGKINDQINKYIHRHQELLNITLIVDESDLSSPTASDNDNDDASQCEKLLSKMYKKVIYALHITGTPHSLLYNITTKLSSNHSVQIPISKVHKMRMVGNYYGLFNNKIKFETKSVVEWWKNSSKSYDISYDYDVNIKPIITKIIQRKDVKYNSFLISEEKTRDKQHSIINDKILKDFSNLFVILFNGKHFRLYLKENYVKELKKILQSDKYTNPYHLYSFGGIYGSYIDDGLPNKYVYYNISNKYNLKQIYRALSMFFEKSKVNIKYKTVVTISGKYAERGYSFTSDDYKKYTFHLTDQYFPCHVRNKNCTDISQRLRLQGKYENNTNLTLWTSNELKDVIINFYIPFIREIESKIMECSGWNDIKKLIENIIDVGQFKFRKYIKWIDSPKKVRTIVPTNTYNNDVKGHKFFQIKLWDNHDIINYINNLNTELGKYNLEKIPNYSDLANEILCYKKSDFIKRYGKRKYCIISKGISHKLMNYLYIDFRKEVKNEGKRKLYLNEEIEKETKGLFPELKKYEFGHVLKVSDKNYFDGYRSGDRQYNPEIKKKSDKNKKLFYVIYYEPKNQNNCTTNDYINANNIIVTYRDENILTLPEKCDNVPIDSYMIPRKKRKHKFPYKIISKNNIEYVRFSKIKDKYSNSDKLPDYWVSLDGYFCLYDLDKKFDLCRLKIKKVCNKKKKENTEFKNIELNTKKIIKDNSNITPSTIPKLGDNKNIDKYVVKFMREFTRKPSNKSLRTGIIELYKYYVQICNKNKRKFLKRSEFKDSIKDLGYNVEKTKGVSCDGKKGKRGYNVELI